MTLTIPTVTPGEGALHLEIVDTSATRRLIRAEALERLVEYCAQEGHVPVGKPTYRFIPGTPSTIEIRARVRPASRTWIEQILARKAVA